MLQKFSKTVFFLVSLTVMGFILFLIFEDKFLLIYDKYFPCQRSIPYSLGSFDPKFGISKADFLATMAQAEMIWEKPIGKNLFEYKADSSANNLKVNLVYDYRQEATAKIHDLGLAVSDTRASYDTLKAKYETLQKSYQEEKIQYQARITDFQNKQNTYNQKVEYWNKKGGAPENIYKELGSEANMLKVEIAAINTIENNINTQAANINALVVVINRLAETLNINAAVLNTIGKSRGEEFTEGEYKSTIDGQEIDIYEFSTKEKLKRVLAHELGHALGLDHVADPKAIMYRLNEGKGGNLSNDDLTALRAYCKIK